MENPDNLPESKPAETFFERSDRALLAALQNIQKSCARYLVVALALALLVLRALLPDLRIDEISIALLLLVALVLLVPDLATIVDRLKKLKVGSVIELELGERVRQLDHNAERALQDVSAGRLAPPARKSPGAYLLAVPDDRPDRIAQRIAQSAGDPRTALTVLSIELERALRQLAAKASLDPAQVALTPVPALLDHLLQSNVLPAQIAALYRDFWSLRNQVVHSAGHDVPAGQAYQLIDVGLKLLRLLDPAPEFGSGPPED